MRMQVGDLRAAAAAALANAYIAFREFRVAWMHVPALATVSADEPAAQPAVELQEQAHADDAHRACAPVQHDAAVQPPACSACAASGDTYLQGPPGARAQMRSATRLQAPGTAHPGNACNTVGLGAAAARCRPRSPCARPDAARAATKTVTMHRDTDAQFSVATTRDGAGGEAIVPANGLRACTGAAYFSCALECDGLFPDNATLCSFLPSGQNHSVRTLSAYRAQVCCVTTAPGMMARMQPRGRCASAAIESSVIIMPMP